MKKSSAMSKKEKVAIKQYLPSSSEEDSSFSEEDYSSYSEEDCSSSSMILVAKRRVDRTKYESSSSNSEEYTSSSYEDYSSENHSSKTDTNEPLQNSSKVMNKNPPPDDHVNVQIGQRNKNSSSAPASNGKPISQPMAKTTMGNVDVSSKTENHHGENMGSNFEYIMVRGFKVLKCYAHLYEMVYQRYGPIKSTRTKMSKLALEGACTNLLELINDMTTRPLMEWNENIFQHFEVKLSMLEALKLNVEWLRRCFNKVKKNYDKRSKSAKKVEETRESMKTVEVEREHWMAERDELEAKLREANSKISQADKRIGSMKEQLARHIGVLEEEKQEQQQMVIFGEAKIEDLSSQLQTQAAEQFKAPVLSHVISKPESSAMAQEVEELAKLGVEPRDIELVMTEAYVPRSRAVKALKAADGDIVTAIMELSND